VEPDLLKNEIIDLVAQSEVLMPHFHIPLQSGADSVLAAMRRRYNRTLFAEKIYRIKERIPHACIAIDIISGFPAESHSDFEDSFRFVEELPVSYLHVFTYSKRPNTPAAMMPQLHDSLKKERTLRLLTLSEQKHAQFYTEHERTHRPMLCESDNDHGFMYGFTDNYIKVKTPFDSTKINQILDVFLTQECMEKL
jgi:threonylcarbamoyladenosine tRNA methylthiotransferase MtaB